MTSQWGCDIFAYKHLIGIGQASNRRERAFLEHDPEGTNPSLTTNTPLAEIMPPPSRDAVWIRKPYDAPLHFPGVIFNAKQAGVGKLNRSVRGVRLDEYQLISLLDGGVGLSRVFSMLGGEAPIALRNRISARASLQASLLDKRAILVTTMTIAAGAGPGEVG
jgi:hypothetical protein